MPCATGASTSGNIGAVKSGFQGDSTLSAYSHSARKWNTPARWGNLRDRWATTYDASIIKNTRIREGMTSQLRFEAFNFFNHANFANPISNLNAVLSSGGSIDPNTGRIINPGDFGRITSTSNNPRLIQLALKLNF